MNETVPKRFVWNSKVTLGTSTSTLATTTVTNQYQGSFLSERHRDGVSVPGFRQKIANIQDATSTFNGRDIKVKQTPWDFTVRWSPTSAGKRDLEEVSGVHQISGTFSNPASLSIIEADNEAKRKAIAAAWKQRSAFQGGTFLAELRQTIRGIKQPLRALREGLDAYHRRAKKLYRQRGRAGFQSALSGTWLEFQFGWLQNARDIESGLEALKQMGQYRALHFKVSGKSSITSTPGPMFISYTPSVSSYIKQSMRKTDSVIVIYRGAYKVDLPYGWDVDSWGVNTQDFIPAVWEAIPYSFAIDYFSNIGTIIQSYSGILGNIAWVAKTIRREILYHQFGTNLVPFVRAYPIKSSSAGSLGSTEVALTSVTRTSVNASGLIPQLRLTVPDASSLRWLNLAALIRLKTL